MDNFQSLIIKLISNKKEKSKAPTQKQETDEVCFMASTSRVTPVTRSRPAKAPEIVRTQTDRLEGMQIRH